MKKSLFFVATAALVLASCSNDVKIDENTVPVGSNVQQEIAFSAYSHSPKRAISNKTHGAILGPVFADTCVMKVSAVDVTSATAFFDTTSFVHNASGLWEGITRRYWPLSPVQVNFLAIAHANADNESGVTYSASKTAHNFVVEMSDNYAYNTAQYDFMYAIGNGEVTQNGNALAFPAKIDMTFKHTQAYLVFKVKAANEASKAVAIKDIQIKGARTAGIVTIARNDPDAYADEKVDLTWVAPTSGSAYPGGGTATAYNSVTPKQAALDPVLGIDNTKFDTIGHLLVVPYMTSTNTFAEGGFTNFKIIYKLNGNEYEYVYSPATTKLEAGKKYTYNIIFNLHEILIDPVVAEWDADLDGNPGTNDEVNIVIPSVAYKENDVAGTYNIGNTAGTYTSTISGCALSTSYAVTEESAVDWITEVTPISSDENGILNFEFTVTAQANNAAERSATLIFTDGSSNKTKVTITQAAGPVVP